MGAPFAQGLDGCSAGSAGGNHRVEDDRQTGGFVGVGGGGTAIGEVVGEVVVVFYRFEGCGFAVETEVVDGDGVGKEGLDCYFCFSKKGC